MGINREEISDYIEEHGMEGVLLADGLEGAFIGVSCGFGPNKAVYDWDKCVEIYIKRDVGDGYPNSCLCSLYIQENIDFLQ